MHNSELYYKWIPWNGNTENPIVFIHGFLETHSIWYHLPLSRLNRPILLVDVPGFGKSNLLDDNHPSIRYFADEIDTLLTTYNVVNCQIVGHSMGGYIGLELIKKSDKVQKLVLLNSNFWADSEHKKTDRTRVADILLKNKNLFISEAIPNLFIHPEKQQANIEQLIREAKSGTAEWYAYASIAMRERADFTSFVEENSHLLEIIHGEKDTLIPTATLLEKSGEKELHIVQNSGHMSLFEQPEEVMRILQKVLDSPP